MGRKRKDEPASTEDMGRTSSEYPLRRQVSSARRNEKENTPFPCNVKNLQHDSTSDSEGVRKDSWCDDC